MRVEAPWEILGISENATEEEIQAARSRNLKMFHPDKFPQATARQKSIVEEESKKINWAADEMLKRLRAQKNASSSSQPPPRDTQGAPYTTHTYQANEPPLGAMENLQMLIATVGLKRILQVLAIIVPISAGFFQGLYGLGGQSPPVVDNTNRNPGGAVSNSNNSNSPAPTSQPCSLIDPTKSVLSLSYANMCFELQKVRMDLEKGSLVIPLIITNNGEERAIQLTLKNAIGSDCIFCGKEGDCEFTNPDNPSITQGKAPLIIRHAMPTKLELAYPVETKRLIRHTNQLKVLNLLVEFESKNQPPKILSFPIVPILVQNKPLLVSTDDVDIEVYKAYWENDELIIPVILCRKGSSGMMSIPEHPGLIRKETRESYDNSSFQFLDLDSEEHQTSSKLRKGIIIFTIPEDAPIRRTKNIPVFEFLNGSEKLTVRNIPIKNSPQRSNGGLLDGIGDLFPEESSSKNINKNAGRRNMHRP